MNHWFERWREFSKRLARAMLAGFGIAAILGAWQVAQLGGPTTIAGIFGAAGLLLILGALKR